MHAHHAPGPRRYRIIVRGPLPDGHASALEDMSVEPGAGRTTLEGELADQAHVYGMLDRLRDLGLELIDFSPVEH